MIIFRVSNQIDRPVQRVFEFSGNHFNFHPRIEADALISLSQKHNEFNLFEECAAWRLE